VTERYPQLLRTAGRRWWHLPVGLLVAGVVLVLTGALVVFATSAAAALAGVDDPFSDKTRAQDQPLGLLATNLSIIMIIPAVALAVLLVHRERPGWLTSVAGRLRWRLLLRFLPRALAVVLLAFGASLLVPGESTEAHVPGTARLVGLLAIVALTTPLQAAAEEFGFRGYLTQLTASHFARPVVGSLVAALVTATLFALAHGTQDPWLFADRWAFGLVASWLVWRTGGLEASIALHVANNLVSLGYSSVTGTLDESLTATSLDWQYALLDVASIIAFAVVVGRLATRWQVVPWRTSAERDGGHRAGALAADPAVGYPEPRPDRGHWGMG
jgi:membrane protease YdiL (CAAX protease family)